MAAKDIRRDVGDVSPVNYIRPGVESHAVADAITGITKGIISVDAAVQTEKLAADLDAARAGFITGSPATQEAYELGDEEADKEMDRELQPLRNVLDTKKRAVEQGSITADRFQLEADVILQQAISKRPGLAPEFRQMHAQYTGGALIEHLTRREQEMLQEHAKEGERAAKMEEDTMKAQHQILVDAGFGAEAGLVYGNPQAMKSLYMNKYEDIARWSSRKADAAFWRNTTEIDSAQTELEIPQRQAAWSSEFNLTLENVARSVRAAKPQMQAADEDTFAGMVNEFQTAITKAESLLEEQRVTLGLKPEDVSARMALLKQYKEDAMKFLDGSVSLDARKRNSEVWLSKLEAELRQDAPMIAMMGAVEKFAGPVTAAKIMEDSHVMSAQVKTEVAEFFVNKAGKPEAITPIAAGLVASVMKDLFPQGSQTDMATIKVLPEGISVVSRMGTAFAVMPNDKFRARDFTDWVRELSFYKEIIAEKVPDDLRLELARSVGMATYKNVRVGMIQLMQDHPGLKGHLRGNPEMDTDEPIAFKDGFQPTAEQEQAVALANSQLGHKEALDLIESIAKLPDRDKAGEWVWTSRDLVAGQMNLRTVEQAAKKPTTGSAATARGGSSSQPAKRPTGPAKGTVVNGYAFKGDGADPYDPDSWEKVE